MLSSPANGPNMGALPFERKRESQWPSRRAQSSAIEASPERPLGGSLLRLQRHSLEPSGGISGYREMHRRRPEREDAVTQALHRFGSNPRADLTVPTKELAPFEM